MRIRATSGAALLAIGLLLRSAEAQCTSLGIAGATGCGLLPDTAPSFFCVGAPTVGNSTFALNTLVLCNPSPALLFVGTCQPSPVAVSGPFGTNGFCAPGAAGCLVFVGPTIFATLPGQPSALGFFFFLPIPNDPILSGTTFCVQEVNLCLLTPGPCLAVSQGASITIQ
jgi:hypothetical protein